MSAAWFCRINGRDVGPLEEQQLRELVRDGQVLRETLVRTSTSKGWVPAGKIRGLEFPADPMSAGPAADARPVPAEMAANASPPAESAPAPRPRTALKRAKPLEDSSTVLPVVPIEPGGRIQTPPPVPPPIDKSRLDASSSDIHGVRRRPTEVNLSDLPVGVAVSSSSLAETSPAIGSAVTSVPSAAVEPRWSSPPPAPEIPLIVTTAPSAASKPPAPPSDPSAELTPAQRKKLAAKRQLRIMIGATGGTVVALVVVGLLIAFSGKRGAKDQVAVAQVDAAESTEEGSNEAPESSESGGGDSSTASDVASEPARDEGSAKSRAARDEGSASAGGGASTARRAARSDGAGTNGAAGAADIAAAIKSLGGRWFDLSQASAITSKSMKLQVTGAWLDQGSEPEAGSEVDPPAARGSSRRRLCIEIRLTNSQPELPLNYGLWNGAGGAGGKQAAVLLDESDSAYRFVPASEYSDATRQTVPLRLKPGQAVQDLLVFELPEDAGEFEQVRLLLPAAVVGQGNRHLGLKIPRERIADQRPVELAEADRAPGQVPADGVEAMADPPAGAAKGSPAAPAGNAKPTTAAAAKPEPKEETIEDLRKSIAETVREQEAEREKMRAEQRAAAKKQADADDDTQERPPAETNVPADSAPKSPAKKAKRK